MSAERDSVVCGSSKVRRKSSTRHESFSVSHTAVCTKEKSNSLTRKKTVTVYLKHQEYLFKVKNFIVKLNTGTPQYLVNKIFREKKFGHEKYFRKSMSLFFTFYR